MSLRIQGAVDNDVHPPLFGLAERVVSLYRVLATEHSVRLLCVVPNRSRGAVRERADGIEIERVRRAYTSVVWRAERAGLAPMFTVAYAHRAWGGTLAGRMDAEADVWSVDGLNLACLLERRARPLRVYLAQNVEADFFRNVGPGAGRFGAWAGLLAGVERRALHAADLVIAVSAEDAERLASLYGVPGERIEVVENGYDERRMRPPSAAERAAARATLGVREDEHVGVFVGSDVPHNREAARLLVERVYPEVTRAGRFRLVLVGGVAAAFAGAREPWLRCVPPVPDLLPWLHAADLGLNPVYRGAGSNVKLPGYLAAGLPVVTSAFGLRGYGDLAPCVEVAELSSMALAIQARPRPRPGTSERVARYAWATLGRRLADGYARRLGAAAGDGARSVGAPR